MKKITLSILVLSLFAVLPAFSQQTMFFENLSKEIRINLASGYFAAADRYESLGMKSRAEAYRKMGNELMGSWGQVDEDLYSEDIVPEDDDRYGDEETLFQDRNETPAEDAGTGENDLDIIMAFKEYVKAFFQEDLDAVMAMTAEPFYIPFNEQGLSGDEVREMYSVIFEQYPVDEKNSEDVYNMDTLTVNEMENGYYRVDISTKESYDNFFYSLPFWDSFQSYYFMKGEEGKWLLTAISATETSF